MVATIINHLKFVQILANLKKDLCGTTDTGCVFASVARRKTAKTRLMYKTVHCPFDDNLEILYRFRPHLLFSSVLFLAKQNAS